MNPKTLIQQYVNGWREKDLKKILQPLAKDCVVIESHGPTYRGKDDVKKWFHFWLSEKGKVLKWEILSFFYFEKESTAFFEWDFVCNVRGKKYHLPGISLIKFKKGKISFIHEYRMTRESYQWNAKKLNPE